MSDLAADEISSFKANAIAETDLLLRQVMLKMSQSLSEITLDCSEILKDDNGLLFLKRSLSSDKRSSWSTVSDAELDLNN